VTPLKEGGVKSAENMNFLGKTADIWLFFYQQPDIDKIRKKE